MPRAWDFAGSDGAEAVVDLLDLVARPVLPWFWQQQATVSAPPQHPADDAAAVCKRDAWRALQNRVLLGSVRHCAHVPGPEVQGLAIATEGAFWNDCGVEATSPSDGGGVNCAS
jgi:hypothetical protein